MKLLVSGGTVFVGRHIVQAALNRGHEVTLFNRGEHNPDLFPEVVKIRGDRSSNLELLYGRRWDAVVDTCGYLPRVVRLSTEALQSACDLSSEFTSYRLLKTSNNVISGLAQNLTLGAFPPSMPIPRLTYK